MKTLTLYRTAFRNRDEWEQILSDLRVPEEEWDIVDEVELKEFEVKFFA